jgi:hypothetical protein
MFGITTFLNQEATLIDDMLASIQLMKDSLCLCLCLCLCQLDGKIGWVNDGRRRLSTVDLSSASA